MAGKKKYTPDEAYQRKLKSWREHNRVKYATDLEYRDRRRRGNKRWATANPQIVRANKLRNRFGITLEERDAFLGAQGGVCGICQRRDSGTKKDWHVDHDHTTGTIRGILCHGCNTGLGGFRDNVGLLAAAINYLTLSRMLD